MGSGAAFGEGGERDQGPYPDLGPAGDRGAALVSDTGTSLQRIEAVIVEIARSAAEQAIAIDEVNDIVTEMDRTTQQNAAMVEQSTAASHSLSYETEQLAKSVITFRVGSEKPAVGKPRLIAAIHAVAR